MRRAELNAREQRMERYSRIKENMAAEERKMEKQKQRLDQKLKQKEIKEKELENNLNKKLSQAEKQRKIKKVREGKSIIFNTINVRSKIHFPLKFRNLSGRVTFPIWAVIYIDFLNGRFR